MIPLSETTTLDYLLPYLPHLDPSSSMIIGHLEEEVLHASTLPLNMSTVFSLSNQHHHLLLAKQKAFQCASVATYVVVCDCCCALCCNQIPMNEAKSKKGGLPTRLLLKVVRLPAKQFDDYNGRILGVIISITLSFPGCPSIWNWQVLPVCVASYPHTIHPVPKIP